MALRAVKRALLTAVAALLVLAASPSLAAAPERLGYGSYGEVRMGDTPGEVRRKVPGLEPCHRLGALCVCASVEVGVRAVTFVYRLDRRPGVDLIFTAATSVRGPRGLRVGHSTRRMRRLFPNARRARSDYPGFAHFVVRRGRLGLLVLARRGRIIQLTTGKRRFFDYVEYCS